MIKLFMWFFGLCSHDWEKKSETILESGFEQTARLSKKFKMASCGPAFFDKTVVITFQCRKCSEMKVITKRSRD